MADSTASSTTGASRPANTKRRTRAASSEGDKRPARTALAIEQPARAARSARGDDAAAAGVPLDLLPADDALGAGRATVVDPRQRTLDGFETPPDLLASLRDRATLGVTPSTAVGQASPERAMPQSAAGDGQIPVAALVLELAEPEAQMQMRAVTTEDRTIDARPTEPTPTEHRQTEGQSTEVQSTGAQATEAQATEAQATGAQATGAQATGAQATEAQATGAQATGAQATGAQATGAQATEAQATEAQVTEAQATEAQATGAQVTEAQATEPQATEPSPTEPQTSTQPAVVEPPLALHEEPSRLPPRSDKPSTAKSTRGASTRRPAPAQPLAVPAAEFIRPTATESTSRPTAGKTAVDELAQAVAALQAALAEEHRAAREARRLTTRLIAIATGVLFLVLLAGIAQTVVTVRAAHASAVAQEKTGALLRAQQTELAAFIDEASVASADVHKAADALDAKLATLPQPPAARRAPRFAHSRRSTDRSHTATAAVMPLD